MSLKRARENFVTVLVAAARQNTVEFEEHEEWPDAWIVDGGERIPVEVVIAVERPPGEPAQSGSAVIAKLKQLQREADRLTAEDGMGRLVGAHPVGPNEADGWMVSFGPGGKGQWGKPSSPLDPARAIVAAAVQKLNKRYGESGKTLLVVDWGVTSIFHLQEPPNRWDLSSVGPQLTEQGCTFREVWVVIDDPIDNRARVERLFPTN